MDRPELIQRDYFLERNFEKVVLFLPGNARFATNINIKCEKMYASLISAFVTSYILYELISRIPFFRWAVLGIKKEK